MNGWKENWESALRLSLGTPEFLVALLATIFVFIIVALPSVAVLTYVGRKLSADLQARVGPNRSGPAGMFQAFADVLKLLQKDSDAPLDRTEAFWLGFQTMALYSTIVLIPFGSLFVIVDTDMSIFLAFWAVLMLAMGTLLLGLDQKSVPGWIGGLRVAAQASAAAFPALFSILCVGIRAGGFRWSALVQSQGAWPLDWAAFSSPFEFLALIVFMISGLILLNAPPIDGALTSRDLHGGVVAQISGRRLVLQRLGSHYGFFLWSVMAAALFLGGWNLPFGLDNAALQLIVLLLKAFALVIVVVLLSNVTPRLRSDQVTNFSWRVLSPFALISLVGTALWIGWFHFI